MHGVVCRSLNRPLQGRGGWGRVGRGQVQEGGCASLPVLLMPDLSVLTMFDRGLTEV